MAEPNTVNIPQEFRIRDQWVVWKTITRAGKPTKVPYRPNGIEADSSDPVTWSKYDVVVEAYQKGGYDGIGYVFDVLDPYAGVDLDDCINPDGSIKPKAKTICDSLDSYSEISPSGKGIKIFLKAKNPVKIQKKDGKFQQGFNSKKPDLEIEIYYGNRFFTLTGNRLDDYPPTIEDRNATLTALFKDLFKDRGYFKEDQEAHQSEPTSERSEQRETISPDAAERFQLLLTTDPKFEADFTTPAQVGDRSDVEFNLCARLWEAGFDEADIYLIMNSSPQTKWLDRDDNYRWETIRKAVAKSEASHKERVDEEAKKEAAKKSSPIELKDVADIGYDKNGKISEVRFSPTYAARAVLERMPLVMSEDSEDIYHFDGQIYKPNGARIIDVALCDAAADLNTAYQLKEALRRVRNKLLDNPVVFEPNPYLLGVKNGVADLLTGEVREYRAEDLMLEQLDVNYDPSARCPVFLDFIESITPNVSDRITLIDWFVATAVKEPFAYVLFLLGLGRNGKGIYEKLIKKFFGKTAFRDMPLAEVGKNNFAAGGFYRKRGWIASETGKKKAAIGTDFMKLTSGNGSIDGDRKNQSRIQFEPYFQTIVDTNTMPQIADSSIGWQERFVKIDLPYVFVANPNKERNPLERKRDPALYEKLSTPSELSGILNLLLFRSMAIGKSGQIHKRSGAEMFAEYAEQSSSVSAFLDEFCTFVTDGVDFWTPSGPVYEAYCKWCSFKVGEVVDIRYFGKQLKNFCGGFEPKRGKDKDRKSITEYKRLNFDSKRFTEVLEDLQLSISKDVSMMSQCVSMKSQSEKSQKISMSQLSQSKLWIEIKEKFGNPSKDQISPIKKEGANFTETIETIETSTASEHVEEMPHRDTIETLIETKPTITPTPSKCKKIKSYSDMLTLVPFEYDSPIEESICKAFRGLLARGIAPRLDMMIQETGLDADHLRWYLDEAPWIRKDDSSPAGIVVYLPAEAVDA